MAKDRTGRGGAGGFRVGGFGRGRDGDSPKDAEYGDHLGASSTGASSEEEDARRAFPELFRRVMALGLSGFFTTEEAFRRALGETVPKDWVDFVNEQSERTRRELLERMGDELGRVIQQVDLPDLFRLAAERPNDRDHREGPDRARRRGGREARSDAPARSGRCRPRIVSTPAAARHEAWGLDGGLSIGLAISGGGATTAPGRRSSHSRAAPTSWASIPCGFRRCTSSPARAPRPSSRSSRSPQRRTGSDSARPHSCFRSTSPRRSLATSSLLDRVSGGRLIVGLGRGFRPTLFDAFGVDRSIKRDLFDTALDRMLQIWEAEEIAPPLAVAAFGPKGLAQAARRGLPYLPSMIEPIDALEANYRAHEEGLPEGARREEIVVPMLRTVHVAADEQEAERVLDALRLGGRAQAGRAALPKSIERAAAAEPEERVIVGTAAQVVDRLSEYRERVGLDLLVVASALGAGDASERLDSLERLAADVWPQLR